VSLVNAGVQTSSLVVTTLPDVCGAVVNIGRLINQRKISNMARKGGTGEAKNCRELKTAASDDHQNFNLYPILQGEEKMMIFDQKGVEELFGVNSDVSEPAEPEVKTGMENPIEKLFRTAHATTDRFKGFIDDQGFLGMSRQRYHVLLSGGYWPLPGVLLDIAEEVYGVDGRERIKTEYLAFRANISPETLKRLEKLLFPGGPAYGMCP
jgi:hypothetical protein